MLGPHPRPEARHGHGPLQRSPRWRPRPVLVTRAVLARARWSPGRAGLGPGQKNGPRAGPTGSGCMANTKQQEQYEEGKYNMNTTYHFKYIFHTAF